MKGKEIALWVGSVLVALVMVFAGSGKLTASPVMAANFVKWGFPVWFLYFLGAVEVLGGIGLLLPRTRFWAAVGLVPILIGAISTHLTHDDAAHAPLPAVLLLIVLASAWARRDEKGRIFAAGKLLTGV